MARKSISCLRNHRIRHNNDFPPCQFVVVCAVRNTRLEEEQSQTCGPYDCFSAALGCKFAQESVHMKLHGVLANVQAVGNGLVGKSLSEQL
jgi:hypothetical protein